MAHGDGWKLWQQLNGNGGGLIFTLLQLILIITLFLAFYFQNKNKFLSLSLSYTLLTLELSPRARHHRSLLTLWLTFHYILNPGLGREVVNAALLHFLAAKNTVEHDTRYSSQLQFFSTRYTLAILKASQLAFLF